MPVKKRKRGKRKVSRRRRSGQVRWGRWLVFLSLLAMILVGAYGTYISRTIRVQFEGPRWALPARVYARPLELYVGSRVTRDQLIYELDRLGYREVSAKPVTGTWRKTSSGVEFVSRAFRFWDGEEPERHLRVNLDAKGIRAMEDLSSGASAALARLDPLEIGSIHPNQAEDRVLLRFEDIPPQLKVALIAVEDRAFYDHLGVNPKAILRAVIANIRAGRTVQGGSTLTQQLVKNFFLTPERSLRRKAEEALMAVVLETRYTKDEILEAYVNEIFLGQDGNRAIHGFGLASQFYFNKPVAELSLPETALLIGMIKGPSYYNPLRYPERAVQRRNLVLDVLVDQGVVDAAQAQQAKQVPLEVVGRSSPSRSSYPAFIDLVKRQLKRDYREEDLVTEGLRIFTTLDPWAQRQAEAALANRLDELESSRGMTAGTLNGAVVVVTPQDGEVLALAGGRDADYAGFNRALDAMRPIGSLVKPAVYLTALQQPERYALTTLLNDSALSLKAGDGSTWRPQNYDKTEHGAVPLRIALAKSYNLATVRLGLDVGVDSVIDTLRALGVSEPMDPYPSIFLGALALSPLEVAQVYQTFASAGFRSPLRSIREVLDLSGKPLQRYPLTVRKAGQAAPFYLVNKAMQSVVAEGTASYAGSALPGLGLAGKTGTTDNLRDSWFAGFSGDLVGVVWVGRDDNKPSKLSGSSGALRVWVDMMKGINPSPLTLTPPENIQEIAIDPASGLLAGAGCASAVTTPFVRGYTPKQLAPCAGGSAFVQSGDARAGRPGDSTAYRDSDGHPVLQPQKSSANASDKDDPLRRFLRSIFE